MRLDNFIQTAMNNVKNPLLSVLRDINFSSILKQSNFIKRDIGKSPYLIILHFYICLSLIKESLHLWNKALIAIKRMYIIDFLKTVNIIEKTITIKFCKINPNFIYFKKAVDTRVLIIDDTVEIKRGKFRRKL